MMARREQKMSRIHLALNTNHFDDSVVFYTTLFQQAPARQRPGYAKFDLQDPPLNLTLNHTEEPLVRSEISHLGVEVRDADSVAVADARLKAAGLDTFVEEDVTCCYARQDKTWVADPDGHAWEFFYVKDGG
jgi:catechol 2,3-dioxygenase-like lactoylglutathione lyase family enzyme